MESAKRLDWRLAIRANIQLDLRAANQKKRLIEDKSFLISIILIYLFSLFLTTSFDKGKGLELNLQI